MKFSIPTPCHEDRSKMTPDEKGAFCQRCCKTVIDLTKKTNEEIMSIISSAGKVCGMLRREQLAKMPVTNGSWGRMRAFACALMLVFGSALFSCNNHDDQVMGEIMPPSDSLRRSMNSNDSTNESSPVRPEEPSQDTTQKKSTTVKQAPPQTSTTQEEPQQQRPRHNPLPLEPRWNGGSYAETEKEIKQRVKYPEQAKKNSISGTVWVDFTVEASGEATGFKVRQGLGYGCDEEALRVIKSLGKWDPGKQAGQAVDMEYSVGVPFGQ
jgi:TonB family protein